MGAEPLVIALYGPTATGKSAVAERLRTLLDVEVISADSAALYEGLPILTAAPAMPCRLVGVVPLDEDVTVGAYAALAHQAIDETCAAGRTPVVVGGTGLYLRSALAELELPPPPTGDARERWSARYDELGADGAHALLSEQDPAAARRVHANDRRRVIRALELAEMGASLAPAGGDRLFDGPTRHPTLLVGLDLDLEQLDARIAARTAEMVERGVVEEAQRAWAEPLSATARKVLGLEPFATRPVDEAVEQVVTSTRRLARYQRKWLRRLPLAATLDADRTPEENADAIVALARAGERLSGDRGAGRR